MNRAFKLKGVDKGKLKDDESLMEDTYGNFSKETEFTFDFEMK